MPGNSNLNRAKVAKNDEFYTRYCDIEKEINAYYDYNSDVFRGKTILCPCDDPERSNFTKFFINNFQRFGLKKLISTSYAYDSKNTKPGLQTTFFDMLNPNFTPEYKKGKIYTLTDREEPPEDAENLKWYYLEDDGDFRSAEVTKLRDEADSIITNPPFSLFREFVAWIFEAKKKFAVIGNMNAITYKEIFPLIMENKIWLDNPFVRGAGYFTSPLELNKDLSYFNSHDYREGFIRVPGVRWFTNLEHGRRHQPLDLMTMADNIKYSKHKEIKGIGYRKYDNYDAIEVPFTDAIPSDYFSSEKYGKNEKNIEKYLTFGNSAHNPVNRAEQSRAEQQHSCIMGVPISFLDKYCPEQFEIIGATESEGKGLFNGIWDESSGVAQATVNGERVYKRIFIRHKMQRSDGSTD